MKRLLIFIPLILACGPMFYQAPPSIPHYLERTPTKNWREILESANPANLESRPDLISDLRAFSLHINDFPKETQLEKTADFITRNRQGHFAISVANYLLELRELIELETPPDELLAYLEWRCLRLPPPSRPQAPNFAWNAKPEEKKAAKLAFNQELLNFLSAHDDRINSASPRIKPFELTQRAGMFYTTGYLELAQSDFQDILHDYPDHPRAEVAHFMLARVSLQALRKLRPEKFPDQNLFRSSREKLTKETTDLFQQYLEKYPQGRFANDCFGWLGGMARDNHHLRDAIDLQIQRLASRPTREVTFAVLRECDLIFIQIFREAAKSSAQADIDSYYYPDLPNFDRLASQPLLARLFVSHALDPAARIHLPVYQENTSGDRGTIEFLKQRIIAPGQFAQVGLNQLGTAIVKNGTPSDPTSLLILGWAATRSGENNQALTLFNLGLNTEVTDELLHGKAVALSRLNQHAEAAKTYVQLFEQFPHSSLVPPSRFDLAMAHLDSGNPGLALPILLQLQHDRTRSEKDRQNPDPLYLHPELEVPQWIDTLIQFSPLEQLEAALLSIQPNKPGYDLLRRALSMRALCEEKFSMTEALTVPEPQPAKPSPNRWYPESYFNLSPERWARDVAPLIDFQNKLAAENLPSGEQARLHLELARHWQSLRGQLTLPLHHLAGVANSETDLLDRLRVDNARHLGLSREAINEALVSRDELSHALRHFLAAADLSQDPDLTAPALEAANETLFRLAEFSPFRAALASERNDTALSQKLVARLRTEFPDRPETHRAIAYKFLPPLLLGNWLPGDRNTWIGDLEIAEVFANNGENNPFGILQSLNKLANGTAPLPDIQASLAQLDQEFQTLRSDLDPENLVLLSDHLADLQLLAHHPGITADDFRQYLTIRLSKNAPPRSADPTQPLAPFLDFLHFARTPALNNSWPDYLAIHPNGPKNEAISLRLTRTQIRRAFPLPHVKALFFPDAPRSEGYKHLTIPPAVGDPVVATQLLASHRQQFPQASFAADLDLLDAAIAAGDKDYPRALKLLAQILTDPNHPELYQDASLRFAELSLRLLDLNERLQLIPAFQNDPKALAVLKKLVSSNTCLARLRPLIPLK